MPRPLLVPCVGGIDVIAMGHGSWVMWVMGQLCDGSYRSWVTKFDPFPSLNVTVLSYSARRVREMHTAVTVHYRNCPAPNVISRQNWQHSKPRTLGGLGVLQRFLGRWGEKGTVLGLFKSMCPIGDAIVWWLACSTTGREVVGSSLAGCGPSRSNRGPVALCTLGLGLLNPPSSRGR